MTPNPQDASQRPAAHIAIWVIVVLIVAPELVVWCADMGLVGAPTWRILSVQYGAFWPGLLQNWQPNYAAQPWVMFLSYSFLHGGILHLFGNAVVLMWLGPTVTQHLGIRGFLTVWVLSALGGAIAFATLTNGVTPMVGASGSVFGLFGAVVAAQYLWSGRYVAAFGISVGLVILNIVTLIVENGFLAWQPHLGGYITGALIALLWLAGFRQSKT